MPRAVDCCHPDFISVGDDSDLGQPVDGPYGSGLAPGDLPGEGPAPGRWVKNRPERHLAPALFTAGTGYGASVSCGYSRFSPRSQQMLGASHARMRTGWDDCGVACSRASGPRGGRKGDRHYWRSGVHECAVA